MLHSSNNSGCWFGTLVQNISNSHWPYYWYQLCSPVWISCAALTVRPPPVCLLPCWVQTLLWCLCSNPCNHYNKKWQDSKSRFVWRDLAATSLLAEVSHGEKKCTRGETSAGFRRLFMKLRNRFLVETDQFLKPVPFNVCWDCLVRLEADTLLSLQSIMANRFCGLCRTWETCHWLLRKRQRLRDRERVSIWQKLRHSFISRPERPLLAGKQQQQLY